MRIDWPVMAWTSAVVQPTSSNITTADLRRPWKTSPAFDRPKRVRIWEHAMLLLRRFERAVPARSENLSQANKLSRTYSTLLEALNRHRG